MREVIPVFERAFRDRALEQGFDVPRKRTSPPGVHLHFLQGAAPRIKLISAKSYYVLPKGRAFHLHPMNHALGQQRTLIETDWLGRKRTGAPTATATNVLARSNASVVACFGTGRHGHTQPEASRLCAQADRGASLRPRLGALEHIPRSHDPPAWCIHAPGWVWHRGA